jgi:hypothetical protein
MGVNSAIGRQARAVKEPHQMTPEEFSSAPNAVFHTSHKHEVLNMQNRADDFEGAGTSPHIHVGTEQAALENASRTIQQGAGEVSEWSGDGTYAARLHTYHYTAKPGDNFDLHNDGEVYTKPQYVAAGHGHPDTLHETYPDYSEENYGRHKFDGNSKYEYTHDYHDMPAMFYKNTGEDDGSVSISIADTSRLKSHGDYVRNAIANGKGDEVHPVTMQMYKEGRLDKGAYLPTGFAHSAAMNAGNSQYVDHKGPGLGSFSLDNLSKEDAEVTKDAFGIKPWSWTDQHAHHDPTEKYSDKGLNMDYLNRKQAGLS